MRVLGIDPGSRFMGFGVIEERLGKIHHVGHGVIRADVDESLEHRLRILYAGLETALAKYQPDAVAVEGVFAFRNARSALILGHARGVALLVAAQRGLAVHEYPPARVKRSVGASGGASKDSVERMVRTLLRIGALERSDAADALAVAICHVNQSRGVLGSHAAGGRKKAAGNFESRLLPSYRRFEV